MTVPSSVGADLVGSHVVLEVGSVAHGGHCVARHEGRVVFVRHALPGERVEAVITEGRPQDRFLRADAVEVLDPSPHRVPPACRYAGPGRCGGCDFQHASLEHQRGLKAAVVREQFARLAGLDVEVEVEPIPGGADAAGDGPQDGLRWRTRVQFAVGPDGRPGLRRHRSHDVVAVDDCLIASHRVVESGVLAARWPGCTAVEVVAADEPPEAVVRPVRQAAGGARRRRHDDGRPQPPEEPPGEPPGEPPEAVPYVVQRVATGSWAAAFRLRASSFWQVHPGAARTLVGQVLQELAPRPGERVVDLYAGVGLFALALADAVGTKGSVLAVEADLRAVEDGRANLAGRPHVEYRAGRVDQVLRRWRDQGVGADLVVLDPPRTGAGRAVVAGVAGLGPRALAYVACDPAALARDTAYLRAAGYRLRSLRAFDAFPMTHHVECVALFTPPDSSAVGPHGIGSEPQTNRDAGDGARKGA